MVFNHERQQREGLKALTVRMIAKTSLTVALTQALLTQFAPFFLFTTPAAAQSGPNAGQVLLRSTVACVTEQPAKVDPGQI